MEWKTIDGPKEEMQMISVWFVTSVYKQHFARLSVPVDWN